MEFPLSFVVVGSGFRSLFYARIAKRFPQFFTLKYLLCRTEEKAQKLNAEYGIPTTHRRSSAWKQSRILWWWQ